MSAAELLEPFAGGLVEPTGRFFFGVQLVFLPGLVSAFQFHYRIAFGGKAGAGIGGQMTLLGVAIDYVGLVPVKPLGIVPFLFGQIDRSRDVAFGEIFAG